MAPVPKPSPIVPTVPSATPPEKSPNSQTHANVTHTDGTPFLFNDSARNLASQFKHFSAGFSSSLSLSLLSLSLSLPLLSPLSLPHSYFSSYFLLSLVLGSIQGTPQLAFRATR